MAWVSASTKLAGSKRLKHHAKAGDFTIQHPCLMKSWTHRTILAPAGFSERKCSHHQLLPPILTRFKLPSYLLSFVKLSFIKALDLYGDCHSLPMTDGFPQTWDSQCLRKFWANRDKLVTLIFTSNKGVLSYVLFIENLQGLFLSKALGEDHKYPLYTNDIDQPCPTEHSAMFCSLSVPFNTVATNYM